MSEQLLEAAPRTLFQNPTEIPAGAYSPTSLAQELPFGKLQWENFERLCLRLIRQKGTIRQCALYGTRGQYQSGIDFYALDESGEYSVFQCKRMKKVTAATIRSAVAKFQRGRWAKTAKHFIFCTTHDLTGAKLQDAIVAAQHVLAEEGITFGTLASEDLVHELKGFPRLVYDFFGKHIASDFCGAEIIEALGRRIETPDLTRLRGELRSLYATVFRIDTRDSVGSDPDLSARFVDLDIGEREIRSSPDARRLPESIQVEHQEAAMATDRGSLVSPSAPPAPQAEPEFRRQTVLRWIGSSEVPSLVLGEVGSGKSTVLRRIALDVLSDEPQLDAIAERFGDRIPLWMPFSSLAKSVSSDDLADRSLVALGKNWLTRFSRGEVGELIGRAFEDERLLLLVDGLDEFSDQTKAGVALKSLAVHVDNRGCDLVASGRPQSLEGLELGPIGWRTGLLAPLTQAQRYGLIRRRFVAAGENDDLEAVRMLETLNDRPEVEELAETPLFLSHLVDLWRAHRALPDTRAGVHDAILRLLLDTHTNRREQAAERPPNLALDELNNDERLALLARLALEMQDKRLITASRALIENCLSRSMEEMFGDGIGPERRRLLKRLLLDTFADRNGILLQLADNEFSFFHRSSQEYLCARALDEMPMVERIDRLLSRLDEPTWQESLRSLLVLSTPDDAIELVNAIEDFSDANPHLLRMELLLGEAAVNGTRLPAGRRVSLLERAIRVVEARHWIPERSALIGVVARALRDMELADSAQTAIGRWFPARSFWQKEAFRQIAKWDPDEQVVACLYRALLNSDSESRIAAALAMERSFAAGLVNVNALLEIAAHDPDVERRSTALLALARNSPAMATDLLEAASQCASLALQLVRAEHRVRAGDRSYELLDILLAALVEDAPIERGWSDFALRAVVDGWRGNERVRDRLIAEFRTLPSRRSTGRLSTWTIDYLVAALFPGDRIVGSFLADQWESPYPFIGFSHEKSFWQLLATNFRDDPHLTAKADAWLTADGRHAVIDASYAALIGRTPAAKRVMLDQLGEIWPHWAMGTLLEGWGADDPEVQAAIQGILSGNLSRASMVANLVPEIEPDPERARSLLLRMLRERPMSRLDFVLYALLRIGVARDDTEVIEVIFSLRNEHNWSIELAESAMLAVPWDERARGIALETLCDPEGFWGSVSSAFGDDQEIRRAVLSRLTPIDANGRATMVGALLRPGTPADFARGILSLYLADEDANVATAASIAYYRIEAQRVGVGAIKPHLASELVRGGIHHEQHAQTAFAAALDLDVPQVILDARSSWSPDRVVSVPLAHIYTPNLPLVRGVLAHWKELHNWFGDDFGRRFDAEGVDADVWNQLVVALDEFPEIAAEALDHFASVGPVPSGYHQSTDVLAFLARVNPAGAILRQFCVALVTRSGGDLGSWQAEQFAAELLAMHFRGREDVLSELVDRAHPWPAPFADHILLTDGMLCTLGDGWVDSDLLDIAWNMLGGGDDATHGHAEGAIAALWAARSTAEQLMRWMDRRISQQSRVEPPDRRARRRALVARFRRDEVIRGFASDVVLEPTSAPSNRISMTNLLLSSGAALAPEISKYARDQLVVLAKAPAAVTNSDIGFDLLTGQETTAFLVLVQAER